MKWTDGNSEWLFIHMGLIPCSGQPVQKFQCPSICPHPDQNPSSESRGTASIELLFINLDRAWIMFWWNILNQYKLFACTLYFHVWAKYLYFRVASNSELKYKDSVYAGASEKVTIRSSNITLKQWSFNLIASVIFFPKYRNNILF